MAGTIRGSQFVRMAQQREQELWAAHAETERLNEQNLTQAEKLKAAREKVLEELTALILPSLAAADVAQVNTLTGFRGFMVNDPTTEFRQRRDALSQRIVAIEQDPRYLNRERLTHEVAGELTAQRAEILRQLAILNPSLQRFTAQSRFEMLVQRGYGTRDYKYSWTSLEYYRDWRDADACEEALSPPAAKGQKRRLMPFAELAEQYRPLRAAAAAYGEDLAAVEAKIKAINDLVAERKAAIKDLPQMARTVLLECRGKLREHLLYLDREELGQRAANVPDLLTAVKKLHGIEKQIEYLEELRLNFIQPERLALGTYITKIKRKIEKFSRPKHRSAVLSSVDANNWLKDPRPKIVERRKRYGVAAQKLLSFRSYDTYSYGHNNLWWDFMLGEALNGDFVPEVVNHRRQYPRSSKNIISQPRTPDITPPQRRNEFLDVS